MGNELRLAALVRRIIPHAWLHAEEQACQSHA
jgi:hypothetical protein